MSLNNNYFEPVKFYFFNNLITNLNLKRLTKVTSVNSKMYIIGIKAKYNEELLLEKIELISKNTRDRRKISKEIRRIYSPVYLE